MKWLSMSGGGWGDGGKERGREREEKWGKQSTHGMRGKTETKKRNKGMRGGEGVLLHYPKSKAQPSTAGV